MLITERTSDGRTIVRLHKDWHPGRMGIAHISKPRNYVDNADARHLQRALLSHYDDSRLARRPI